MRSSTPTEELNLTDRDLAAFAGIRVSGELLAESGVRRVTDAEARNEYGIVYRHGALDGVVYEYRNPFGERVNARLRRDAPEMERGKEKNKYVSAMYDAKHLYFPPNCAPMLADTSIPVVIVESEKSVLALTALSRRTLRPLLAIGLGGCWGFRGRIGKTTSPSGARVDELGVLPDFDHIEWAGRLVAFCFDSNVETNGRVQAAERALARVLRNRDADVRCVRIPQEPKVNGPDDYIGAHTDAETLRLLDGARKDGTECPVLVRLSDVAAEDISWLWQDRFALGKLSLLIGDPGGGKSTMLVDTGCRVSKGAAWPDGGCAELGSIIVLTAEDGIADTLRPRVDIHGGDPSRFHVLQGIRTGEDERPFSLESDMGALESAIESLPDVRLIIIDPLSAYLGEKDSYKDSQIRAILTPLAKLAERCRVAIVGIVHMTKASEKKALYRALGSVAFVAAARTVFAIGKDAEDDRRRIFVYVKSNLAAPPPALAFSIVQQADGRGVLTWEDKPIEGVDADSILSAPATHEEREERQSVDDFLRELLADGQVSSNAVYQAARQNGLSDSTVNRAKRRLRIEAIKVGQPGEKGKWYWSLPADGPLAKVVTEPSKVVKEREMTTFEQAVGAKAINSIGSPKTVTPPPMTTFETTNDNLREEL